MAQKIITIVTDDLTGEESEEARTVPLSVDGINYELDLSPDSHDKLLDALAPFLRVARRTGKVRHTPKKPGPTPKGRAGTQEVREWAKKQGYTVSNRGRVPSNIMEAYNESH